MARKIDNKTLVDPADEQGKGNGIDPDVDGSLDSLKVKPHKESDDLLSFKDIGAVSQRKVEAPHPFDGFQLARKVAVGVDGKLKVSATYLVLLKPTEHPQEDRSNDAVTIAFSKEPGKGGDPKNGPTLTKVVKLDTFHTQVVMNRHGNENIQIVFDREVLVDGEWYRCAVVPSHAARAQLVYAWDVKRKRVVIDKRYMIADMRQAKPLLEMYKAMMYQRTAAERSAKEFDDLQETTALDK